VRCAALNKQAGLVGSKEPEPAVVLLEELDPPDRVLLRERRSLDSVFAAGKGIPMAVWHNDREELYLFQSDVLEMTHISLSVSARI